MDDDKDNPLWHRWPFKGWREDTAVSVISLVLLVLLVATLRAC
jgi:hypothetical protein